MIVSIVPETGLQLLAGDVLREVDDVGADIAERTGTGEVLLQPPSQRHRRVDEPVLQVDRAHLVDLAHLACAHQVTGEGGRGHPAVGVAEHRPDTLRGRALRGRRHRLRLFDGVGEGLLAEHVLAGVERRDRDLRVRVTRGDDVDDLDVVPGDHVAPVGRALGPAPLLGGRGDGFRIPADHDIHRRRGVEFEEPGGDAPALGMGGAHEPVADHCDAEARCSRHCCSLVGGCGPGAGAPGPQAIRTRRRSGGTSRRSPW